MYKLMRALIILVPLCSLVSAGQLIHEDKGLVTLTFGAPKDAPGSDEFPTVRMRGRLAKTQGEVAASAELKSAQQFTMRIVDANASGSEEKILALWDGAERAPISKKLADRDAAERNAAIYRRIAATEVIAAIHYGPYRLIVVRHSGVGLNEHLRTYPAIVRADRLLLTNKLAEDRFFTSIMPLVEKALNKEAGGSK